MGWLFDIPPGHKVFDLMLYSARYVAKYYNLSDIMDFLRDDFELMSIERTFTEENLGKDIEDVERDFRARQMWIHLIKK